MTLIQQALARIEEMERRADEATPGPLTVVRGAAYKDAPDIFDHEAALYPPDTTETHGFQYGGPVAIVQDNGDANDADFFARANVDYKALCALVKAILTDGAGFNWSAFPAVEAALKAFVEAK